MGTESSPKPADSNTAETSSKQSDNKEQLGKSKTDDDIG
jgi:hypothetical protein